MSGKSFLSRREQYQRNPNLRNRSLILAQNLDALKNQPDYKDFKRILTRAILDVRFVGRDSKKERRRLVEKALNSFAYELEEIISDTKLTKKQVLRVLAVFERAKMIVVRTRTIDGNSRSLLTVKVYVPVKHLERKQ